MSKPSFSNIDLWLFELAEGNLNEQQIEELRIFLLQHPELDVEKDVWEMAKVDSTKEVYPDVHLLEKKEPSRRYFAMGSISLLLLIFVGCYQYFDKMEHINVNKGDNGLSSTQGSLRSTSAVNSAAYKAAHGLKYHTVEKQYTAEESYNSQANGSDEDSTPSPSEDQLPVNRPSALNYTSVNFGLWQSSVQSSEYGSDLQEMIVSSAMNNSVIDEDVLGNDPVTEAKKDVAKLETKKVRSIDVASSSTTRYHSRPSHTVTSTFSSSYHESFRSKLKKSLSKVQRMLDNPVALKNYRDPYYHVPGLTTTEVNFSSTGTMLRTRVQTLSRLQWYGQENEQLMNTVSLDGYSYGMRGGIGVQMKHSMYNKGGIHNSEIALTYSPKFSVNHFISVEPSVRFKMGNKYLNNNRMNGVEQVEVDRGNVYDYYADGTVPVGNMLWYKDLGAGLMVNTKWFFAGVQMDNLFEHKDNIYSNDLTNPRRAGKQFIATIGTDWESRKENMTLSPYIVYINNEQVSDVWFGANYRLGWFTVGGAVSTNMEPAASLGLKFEHFALQYNADYLTSTMSGKPALSHQLSLRFTSKPSRYGRKLLNL